MMPDCTCPVCALERSAQRFLARPWWGAVTLEALTGVAREPVCPPCWWATEWDAAAG